MDTCESKRMYITVATRVSGAHLDNGVCSAKKHITGDVKHSMWSITARYRNTSSSPPNHQRVNLYRSVCKFWSNDTLRPANEYRRPLGFHSRHALADRVESGRPSPDPLGDQNLPAHVLFCRAVWVLHPNVLCVHVADPISQSTSR